MKRISLAIATGALLAMSATPAFADPPPWAPAHGERAHRDHDRRDYRRGDVYDRYGRYRHPRRVTRDTRVWEGRDGRYYCRRSNGTTGLIVGAAGGALIGHSLDHHRDKTTGTLLGAAIGGLLGHAIDKGDAYCR